MYCLVVTYDYSRFTRVFFLSTKDETSGILKSFITRVENLVDHKVKVIRCDNETKFKNRDMNQFCKMKGIMRQYSIARTPQQNETKVHHQRPTKHGVNKVHSPQRRPINLRQSPQASNYHPKVTTAKIPQVNAVHGVKRNWGNSQHALKDKGVIDSGCLRHMTGNMSFFSNFKEINHGYIAFGGNPKGEKITGKIRTGKLNFDDVYFVKELKFNLFSVSQMCDKKNSVLFTDTKCIVLSSDFKLPDENHDETSTILKTFITGIENQSSLKVKITRSDNGTEFKNQDLNQFCGMKGIKREFSVARTPQHNGIAKRKNMNLIKAARTMLADSLLPISFWAEVKDKPRKEQNQNKTRQHQEQTESVEKPDKVKAQVPPVRAASIARTIPGACHVWSGLGCTWRFPVIHQPPQEMSIQEMKDLKQQYLDEMKCLINSKYRDEIKIDELKENFNSMSIEINKKEKLQQLEQVANLSTYPLKRFNSFCYDDDDDDYAFAITPNKPDYSLSMGDEHLDTILATESDEFIKSSVENLVPIPSEPEGESECDIDSILNEFAGELTLLKSILPGIDETDCDLEEEIRLIERLLYDNSSPRSPEEFVSENSDTKIESFSPSPIPVEDSDSLMEEIDSSFTLDYPMPPSIEDDDYDSKRDILILKDLPCNDTLSLPEIESFHFDIPSFSRPPAKPPDGNTGILNVKMMRDISEQKVPMPKLMITLASNQEKSPDLLSH
nr:putative ribonuclease H-like domain-containing protein [Tanacetum cinerariifolium]